MPALTFAPHLSVARQTRHHPVQVVGFDAHLFRDLRNRDARCALHELERLIGAGATAAPAARPTRPATRRPPCRPCRRSARGARATRATSAADERGTRRLQPGDLLLELAEAVIDFLHGAIDKTSQITLPLEIDDCRKHDTCSY